MARLPSRLTRRRAAASAARASARPTARASAAAQALAPSAALWLSAALALCAALHVQHLPLWITLLFAGAALWRVRVEWLRHPLPPRWLLLPLALTVAAGVFVYAGTVFGRDAGTALLAAMTALKLLEARSRRDGAVLTSLGLLLLMASLLYAQDLLAAVVVIAALAVLLAAQLALHVHGAGLPALAALRLVGRMMLQAVPLTLILFILFPRIPGPLWSLPSDAHSGRSGLSDTMEPGSISNLIQSGAVAFRVRFADQAPRLAQMYWRGPVLWNFDGRVWRGADDTPLPRLPYTPRGERVRYSVTLEPHAQRWLFALELPVSLPEKAGLTRWHELKRSEPVTERLLYSIDSALDYSSSALPASDRARALALPARGNAHARELARGWRESARDDRQVIATALEMFRAQAFYYTLQPPRLGREGVDEFLFVTRRGFCEHYAGSFVFLMRAAGIPARVVTGYQGGERNGGYYIVRQSDAHAWAEVWLPEGGWLRIDPTAAVAPQRIEQGLYAAADDAEALPLLARRGTSVLRELALAWDRANNTWNDWVLAYGPQRQQRFLSSLGFGAIDWRQMTLAMVIASAVVLAAAVTWAWVRRRRAADPLARLYTALCRKLARRGLAREPHEGPLAFAARVARTRPDLAAQLEPIAALYARLRFGAASERAELARLRQWVSAFRP